MKNYKPATLFVRRLAIITNYDLSKLISNQIKLKKVMVLKQLFFRLYGTKETEEIIEMRNTA